MTITFIYQRLDLLDPRRFINSATMNDNLTSDSQHKGNTDDPWTSGRPTSKVMTRAKNTVQTGIGSST